MRKKKRTKKKARRSGAKKKTTRRTRRPSGGHPVAKKKKTKKARRSNPKRSHAKRSHTKRRRSNPSHAHHKHGRRRRRRKSNPGMAVLDIALAPVAGTAANIASKQLPKLATSSPWGRRIAGGVVAAAGMGLSIIAPRIGSAIATGGLDAAVADDANAAIDSAMSKGGGGGQVAGLPGRGAYGRFMPATGTAQRSPYPDAIDAVIEGLDNPDTMAAIVDAYGR